VPLEHYQLYLKLEVNTGYLLYNIIMQDEFTVEFKSQARHQNSRISRVYIPSRIDKVTVHVS